MSTSVFHSIRQAAVNYVAALTINVSLIWGQPASTVTVSPPPMVMAYRQSLVDGRWDVRELVGGPEPRVLVFDLSAAGKRYELPSIVSLN